MTPPGSPLRRPSRAAIVLVLLVAAALRLVALPAAPPGMTGIPPGMTHDEADHGLTAWGIVNGTHGVYFAVGYGREPLYDYTTAAVMRVTGPTIFAARLTSVFFSLLFIAAVYAWARRAFGDATALLTAAGLAVGFWPLMTARQALRSIALPALFALAVLVYWQGLFRERGSRGAGGQGGGQALARFRAPLLPFAIAGLLLGLTIYTYLPARVMWLALPALAGYVWLWRRARQVARPSGFRLGPALTLLVAAVIAAPLAAYLLANPALEVRVGELSAPLRAAAGGDIGPLWANATAALRLFTVEGDQTWRYNIPGRPFLPWPLSWLFYAGLAVAGWLVVRGLRGREGPAAPGAFLALAWLALGFAPVLVTGPGLSTTQAIGAQPVVYLFPALALTVAWQWFSGSAVVRRRATGIVSSVVAALIAMLLYGTVGVITSRAYFGQWANHPEVRVQYETTMVTALRRLDEIGGGAAAVSTIAPGPLHTPAVALLTLRNPAVRPRYFDGRTSLILPDDPASKLLLPGFTPLPPELQPYLAGAMLVDELPMRPNDLDRPVRIYEVDGPAAIEAAMVQMARPDGGAAPVVFGEEAALLGYDLSAAEARPGETVTLVTAWRLLRPLPGAMLFAHVVGPDGEPLVAGDALGAPGEGWTAGDVLLQAHTLTVPDDTSPGEYPLVVGIYRQADGARLPTAGGDSALLTTLRIVE